MAFDPVKMALAPFWGGKGPVTKKVFFMTYASKKKKQRPEMDAVTDFFSGKNFGMPLTRISS